jgi:hypothetical protein
MLPEELKQNITVYGPLFPEPVQVIIVVPMGSSVKLIGKGSGWHGRRTSSIATSFSGGSSRTTTIILSWSPPSKPFFDASASFAMPRRMSMNSGTRVPALSTATATLFRLEKRTGGRNSLKKGSDCFPTAWQRMKSGGNYLSPMACLAFRSPRCTPGRCDASTWR